MRCFRVFVTVGRSSVLIRGLYTPYLDDETDTWDVGRCTRDANICTKTLIKSLPPSAEGCADVEVHNYHLKQTSQRISHTLKDKDHIEHLDGPISTQTDMTEISLKWKKYCLFKSGTAFWTSPSALTFFQTCSTKTLSLWSSPCKGQMSTGSFCSSGKWVCPTAEHFSPVTVTVLCHALLCF